MEKVITRAVIVFPMRKRSVLLAFKPETVETAGKIGTDCWNGYGGEIESGETAAQAAARELFEESKLRSQPKHFEKVAEIAFHNQTLDGSFFTCTCDVFIVRIWEGTAKGTETMRTPTWFHVSKLPLDRMMPADKTWVPLALNGWKIIGHAWYGPRQKMLLQPTRVKYVSGFAS